MRTVRLFAVLSIDGFIVSWDAQQLYDPDFYEYVKYYRDAAIVLTSSEKDYRYLVHKVGVAKDKIAIADISPSPDSINNDTAEKMLKSIHRQKKRKNGYMAITENNKKLITLLLNEGLVDEIILCLLPIIQGKGKRPFLSIEAPSVWKVRSRVISDSGITTIHYCWQLIK